MQYAELKTQLLKHAVETGANNANVLPAHITEAIPPKYVTRWMKWLEASNHTVDRIPTTPRLINSYTLGADPEFAIQSTSGRSGTAHSLGLHAGLAFGMDTNGRLVELRPAPSRFALDIIASILVELRWLSIMVPESMTYSWNSVPFDGNDGVGGHVHFARKRNGADLLKETNAFDVIYGDFTEANIFHKAMCINRRRNSHYGAAGDYRLQKHGYEYRSFPTWLDSPWLAYLTIVMTKLVLADPAMYSYLSQNVRAKGYRYYEQALTNFLSYYKSDDDDAAIALRALRVHGLPTQTGSDFRQNWGILYGRVADRPHHIPTMIEPTEVERAAVFAYLIKGEPVAPTVPVANWQPLRYPDGYSALLKFTQTYRRIGVGELVSDLVCHDASPVYVGAADSRRSNLTLPKEYFGNGYVTKVREFWKQNFPDEEVQIHTDGSAISFVVSGRMREVKYLSTLKTFLTSGLFPIWKAKEVTASSYNEFLNEFPKGRIKLKGKEIK